MSENQQEKLIMLVQQLIDLLRSTLTGNAPMLRPGPAQRLRNDLLETLKSELNEVVSARDDELL